MSHAKPFAAYVVNNLYDNSVFESDIPALLVASCAVQESAAAFAAVKNLFADTTPVQLNEGQLEDALIKPLFALLGWHTLPKEGKTVQGKIITPDWTLFAGLEAKDTYLALSQDKRRDTMDGIIAFAEVKAADKALDTKKADRKENPYLQLLEYLTLTHLPLGFLTNGVEWWLVDNQKISADKRYLRVHLARIVADDNADAFHCFYGMFRSAAFVPKSPKASPVFDDINRLDSARREQSEEDLRKVIYGEGGAESFFELAGRALFAAAGGHNDSEVLRQAYENSLYFAFRLLFMAYFEDKHWEALKEHPHLSEFSLRKLYQYLQESRFGDFVGRDHVQPTWADELVNRDHLKGAWDGSFSGWDYLQKLFRTLDEGNLNLAIPMLNGGLFNNDKAPLLCRHQVMDNATLRQIFTALFSFGTPDAPLRRDFKSLSVTHLGSIYEGLLEFEFRIEDTDQVYMVYKESKKQGKTSVATRHEGYYDAYDAAQITKDAHTTVLASRTFPKNTLYLASNKNDRKASASFYTPQSLTLPLVGRAIDHQLATMPESMSVLDLRILDNACGSGHLLIESLNYLTRCALTRVHSDTRLAAALREEMQRICEAMDTLRLPKVLRPDEFMVLKRILLKKVIYGVDVQVFAIDLAHLSLWIETFIFGTPLSLIEHHIKAGNALIGTEIKKFLNILSKEGRQLNMLEMTIKENFTKLHSVYTQLSAIQDTTAQDIAKSKNLFAQGIGSALIELNLLLDVCNYKDMLFAEGKAHEANKVCVWEQAPALLKGEMPELKADINVYRSKYGFFNWETEFPDAFANGNGNGNGKGNDKGKGQRGFHIIIGNPPWDKTKFEDPLFFSQYRSRYRTLPESKKREIREDLLAKRSIHARYITQQSRIQAMNEYCKSFYPLNKGAGDGNLFRFFVERNLTLLLPNGSLNYVLPTGLLTEDGSATLRKAIFEKYTLTAFDGLENREKIFPDVDSRYKFGLLQIAKAHNPNQTARTRFMLTDPAVLLTQEGVFEYSLDDIRATSPEHMAYMEVAHGRDDLALLTRMYQQFQPLNAAWSDFRTELHATNDKDIFLERNPDWIDFRRELDATNDKDIFLEQKKDGLLPLYKGASIWQYDSCYTALTSGQELLVPGVPVRKHKVRPTANEYWLDRAQFDAHLRDREISRLIENVYPSLVVKDGQTQEQAVLSALGLHRREELGQFVVPDRCYFRLGFRDIARDTDERTLICALLPKDIGAQNTLYVSIPKYYIFDKSSRTIRTQEFPVERLLFIQGLFNTIPVDWVLRFSAAIHVNKTYLMRQPMPQPTDAELAANSVYQEMVLNSLKLSLHYNRAGFVELQDRFAIQDREIPTTTKQVDMLKIRNDVLVAGLYGITGPEMAHVLKSFKVLANKRPEYVTGLLEQMGVTS